VISPLVALMNDQVQALSARGVSATFLASNSTGLRSAAAWRAWPRANFSLV
jgi:superfamily II DNA helicase RecQ